MWRTREASSLLNERLRAFRAEHARVSTAAVLALFFVLVFAGLALARLASAGPEIVNANIATRYVVLPGQKDSQVRAVTATTQGPRKVVSVKRVIRKPGRVTTESEAFTVTGPLRVERGLTTTVHDPARTVTVAGPVDTVTQVVVTTVTVEVTTTVKKDPGPP